MKSFEYFLKCSEKLDLFDPSFYRPKSKEGFFIASSDQIHRLLMVREMRIVIVADFQKNLCPLLVESKISATTSALYDAPYILFGRQMQTACRTVQHTHTVCMNPHCWKSCRTKSDTVLLK